jgi:hypothetical protein
MERKLMKEKWNYLIGKKFSKLVVLEHIYSNRWLCRCECGNTTVVNKDRLESGHTKSCGCLRIKHGFWNTSYSKGKMKFYKMWQGMKARCDNPNLDYYKNYGGRNITYDPRWEDFLNFKDDMYFGYIYSKKQLKMENPSLERIDVNEDYFFENCTFIERNDQMKNTRSVISFIAISPEGKKFITKNVNDFSREHGLNSSHVYECLKGEAGTHKGWRFKFS